MLSHSSSLDAYCLPPAQSFLFNRQKFSMGLRSGGEDDHVINFSLLNPTFARYSTVERAACDGALSCMKIIFFLNAGRLLRYQGIKLSWRKFQYVSAFIFTPSGTLKSPKHDTTTTLLSSHSWWFAAALYKPTSAQAIWSIEGCSALICGKNGLDVCLDIQFADFCAWWLREGEYWVSQARQLCWGSGNE